MFITGKHLSRRTVLRGLGATVALPFLEAMAPAAAPARGLRKTRLVCIEMVHGAAGSAPIGLAGTCGRRPRPDAPSISRRRVCGRWRRCATR